MIGSTVSHYRIIDKLGEGGMGVVYRAQDTRLARLVALKFLPPGLAAVPSARERFIQEARAASALNHPNVIVVYDVGEQDQHSFIAMELAEGETLRARLAGGPIAIDEIQRLGIQIADGLQAAHGKGIIHRDIKPDNLLLTAAGSVKIMDFGIARLANSSLTETGLLLGTTAYMSPEQVVGGSIDYRSDLWSFGVVLYEMLTGRLPFRHGHGAAAMYEILNGEPEAVESLRSDTPAFLRDLVDAMLRKEPAERPGSAADVAAALRGGAQRVAEDVPSKSIAVLYFENMSADPQSEYYCAGITEDILTDLSKLDQLSVVSRTDVLPFRGKPVKIRQVAEALRVNYVLEGSVRKAGNRVRITAQLIDGRNGYHVWADRFDGLVDDIFDLQSEVARKVADALQLSLSDADEATLARRPTDDVRAYDFYMRGREFLNRRGKANTEAAIRMFEHALQIDATFAAAYAGLGEACVYMYEWYDGASAWLSRSIAMNEKALEQDPDSVEALFGIAMVYDHQSRHAQARRTLEKVLAADPQHVPARLRLGLLVERQQPTPDGLRQALAHYDEAAALRPNDDEPWRCIAMAHTRLNNRDAAQEAALKVIEILSRRLEASLEDPVLLSRLAEAYARLAAREEALASARRAQELAPSDGLVLYHAAATHALLGDVNRSLHLLMAAFESGFKGVIQTARTDSAFDVMHGHPEFLRLTAELE